MDGEAGWIDGDLLTGSFCGRSQQQVKKLIVGPGVYICGGWDPGKGRQAARGPATICDECLQLCTEIIDEDLAG